MTFDLSDHPNPKDVVHLVPRDQLDVEPVRALCGQHMWHDGTINGELRPLGHDYVFLPDPHNVATCGPCLDEAALAHVQTRASSTVSTA